MWAHHLHSDSAALAKASALVLLGWMGHSHPGGCPVPCPHENPLNRFATKERNGLLLYNGRFNEKHDFVALEVIQEQVQLTFSAGEPSASWPCPPPDPSPQAKYFPSQPDLDLAPIPRCARISATPRSLPVTQLTLFFPQGNQPRLCPRSFLEGSVMANGTRSN